MASPQSPWDRMLDDAVTKGLAGPAIDLSLLSPGASEPLPYDYLL